MDVIAHLQNSENLAHAYLVRGGTDTFEQLKNFVQEKAGGAGNPDALCFAYDSLGVDEARELSTFASLKPLGGRKYIVISFNTFTSEAQNALLKIVEEGSGQSVFFFVVDTGAVVLPTLLSRCVVLKQEAQQADLQLAKEFLSMSYAERMGVAEKLGKEGDRGAARALVATLLAHAAQKRGSASALRDLIEADQYLKLSGSSVKSVLGHLALSL